MKMSGWWMAGLVALSPGAMAAGKDALWEITTQMQIEGMPEMPKGFSMPGMPGGLQKQTVCLAEGKQYEPEQQKECKVLEQKQVGRKMTMKVKCKEGTMTVENEQVSKDHWRSKVTMSGEHAGTINSEGKRVGTCDAASEGGMSRETQKMMGEVEAQSAANVYATASFAKPKELDEMLVHAIKGEFLKSKDLLLKVMLDYGLSGLDIIKQIQEAVWKIKELSDRQKLEFVKLCGEAEFRMVEGSDEVIQLEALLASAALLK